KLLLWHGLNLALALSVITLLLGLAILVCRRAWRRAIGPVAALDRVGPETGYHTLVKGMLWVSRTQTRLLQHGYLRYYLLVVLLCLILAVAGALQLEIRHDAFELVSMRPHELVTVLSIAVAAIALTRIRSRFAALACLGVV